MHLFKLDIMFQISIERKKILKIHSQSGLLIFFNSIIRHCPNTSCAFVSLNLLCSQGSFWINLLPHDTHVIMSKYCKVAARMSPSLLTTHHKSLLCASIAFILNYQSDIYHMCFPGGSVSKEAACSAGDPDLLPGLERSPGEGNGNPLQYSCLGNFMVRGAWWVHGVTKSWTQLNN